MSGENARTDDAVGMLTIVVLCVCLPDQSNAGSGGATISIQILTKGMLPFAMFCCRCIQHFDAMQYNRAYTEEEDRIILEMQAKLGNRWSIIAQQLKV